MKHPNMHDRLRDSGGFTLAETLMALAIVGFLTMIVAVGMNIAVKSYSDIRRITDAQAVLDNAMTAVSDELRFSYNIEQTSDDDSEPVQQWAFESPNRGYRLTLGNAENEGISITPSVTGASGKAGQQVVAPGTASPDPIVLPFLNTAAGDNNGVFFVPQLTKLAYNKDKGLWTFEVSVSDGTDEEGRSHNVTSGEISVRPINNVSL